MENNQPVKETRVGDAAVTVWENSVEREGRQDAFLTASIAKRYIDKAGQWKKSNSFTRRELQDAAKAIQETLAFMEIHEHKKRLERHAAEREPQ